MHVFIIESEAIDAKGRVVHNLVRDWAPSSTFYFTNNTTNAWNETITRDHLDGAGIILGDASHANDYEILLVMIGGFENLVGAIITPDKDIIANSENLKPAYIVFSNYEKILQWNRSLRFGLAVCTLKDKFKNVL